MSWTTRLLFVVSSLACGNVQNLQPQIDATEPPGSTDAGSDAASGPMPDSATPHIVASNTVSRADIMTGIEPLVVPTGKIYVLDTDQGSMFDASNSNAPIRIAGN